MDLCPRRKLAKLAFVMLLAAVLPLRCVLGAALEIGAEVGGRYESNASNSNLASDRLADGFFTARLEEGTCGVWVATGAGMPISPARGNKPFDLRN